MSKAVSVPLTIRRTYAAPDLWYSPGGEIKLGCSRCPELSCCGGLATEAPLFDCMSLCCGKPDTCSRYACPRQRRYSGLVNEVGGLALHPYKYAVAESSPLPIYVPYLSDRGTLAGPLDLDAAALCLYSIIDPNTGLAKFSSRRELLAHFRLGARTKVLITASAEDRSVEHFWHMLRVKETARSLLALQPALITTPNFSMHLDTVRHDNLLSMARIAYCFEAFAAAGLPVAPHINARTPHDFDRWISFLENSHSIHTIAYELGTVGRSSVRRRWHVEQLIRLAQAVQRPMALVLRAGSSHLSELNKVFDQLVFVDSSSLMKAKKRQSAVVQGAELRWKQFSTRATEPIDELFQHNVRVSGDFYISRLANSVLP